VRVAFTLEQCWHRVPGGTAVAAVELAEALVARGDVEVVGVAASHRHPPDPAPPIPVRQLPLPRAGLYEAWHGLRRPKVERATGLVDVVHATTIIVPPRSAPLVVTIHDLAFLHDPSFFTRRGLRFFHRGLQLARDDADLVLCSSQATLDDCTANGLERDRLRLVPLGVTVVEPTPDQLRAVRERHGLCRPYLLFVGTREPRKNLTRLVEAFAGIGTGHDLVLAGPAGWGDTSPPPGTIVLGVVARPELRSLYAGADAFVYPSLREGFGLPVLEAMAQGTPVVTSRGTATEEAAGGAAVLVDPTDVDDLRRGIREALARAPELAAAGRARAATASWARCAELTVAAYREVAGR
jgi:glycosyltransferase involved in cell wall biosynthesis